VKSQLAEVSSGRIEYALVGAGPVVLISHGTLGGFDQGLAIASLFDQGCFSYLAVSRAGYLRSDPSTGRTPQEQARSYSELLDHLGLASVAVMGLSGGAPAAIAFSELFPDRCWGLVLLSSITAAPPPLPPLFRLAVLAQDFTMRADFFWSFMHRFGLPMLICSNGVSAAQTARITADPRLLTVVQDIFQPIASSSLRRVGVRIDHEQINDLPVERDLVAKVSTYVAHAANDPLATPSAAARLARFNPAVEQDLYPDGGHLFFVVHRAQVVPRVESFLVEHSPDDHC
jgi:pimeloyl-ACP methyl ester carboxylesterase